jgi:hypothetical protein
MSKAFCFTSNDFWVARKDYFLRVKFCNFLLALTIALQLWALIRNFCGEHKCVIGKHKKCSIMHGNIPLPKKEPPEKKK